MKKLKHPCPVFKKIYKVFKGGQQKIHWYWHDRYNSGGKHTLHPEYEELGFDEALARCLDQPTKVCEDKDGKRRKCYYLDQSHLNNPKRVFLKAVIDFNALLPFQPPALITAYYVDCVTPGDKIIYGN